VVTLVNESGTFGEAFFTGEDVLVLYIAFE
jgi:hypothetical protein